MPMSSTSRPGGRPGTASRRGLRRLAAAVVAVGLTSVLSGCLADQVGTAATVGGERITESELQSQTRSLTDVVPDVDPRLAQQGILRDLILAHVYAEMAKKYDVHVTDGEVSKQLDQIFQQVATQAKGVHRTPREFVVEQLAQSQQQPAYVAPDELETWLHEQLLAQKIQAAVPGTAAVNKAFLDANKHLDITVNPRYGTWSPTHGLTGMLSGGLATSAAQPSS
jgi:SurA-like N-terminal domain